MMEDKDRARREEVLLPLDEETLLKQEILWDVLEKKRREYREDGDSLRNASPLGDSLVIEAEKVFQQVVKEKESLISSQQGETKQEENPQQPLSPRKEVSSPRSKRSRTIEDRVLQRMKTDVEMSRPKNPAIIERRRGSQPIVEHLNAIAINKESGRRRGEASSAYSTSSPSKSGDRNPESSPGDSAILEESPSFRRARNLFYFKATPPSSPTRTPPPIQLVASGSTDSPESPKRRFLAASQYFASLELNQSTPVMERPLSESAISKQPPKSVTTIGQQSSLHIRSKSGSMVNRPSASKLDEAAVQGREKRRIQSAHMSPRSPRSSKRRKSFKKFTKDTISIEAFNESTPPPPSTPPNQFI